MSEEKLYNLSLKDYTLEVWKGKLGYPLNQKDIEELEHIIDYYEQESQQLKEQLEDITLCRDIASGHRKELQDEELRQRRLKEKYKSVLDEIREQLKKIKPDLNFEPWSIYKVSGDKLFDLSQILDKVKE